MNKTTAGGLTFWAIQCPGWFLFLYLVYAQGITAFGYEIGVSMGTQESVTVISEVGAAFWYGFAFADLLIYIPVLGLGLVGHLLDTRWGRMLLAAGLGITIYWPIVSLAALVTARGASGWHISNEIPYWVVCLLTAAWGAWGLWSIIVPARNQKIP